MEILEQLDEARAAINVLEHPFYRRWSAGELSARGARRLRRRVPPRGGGARGGLRAGGADAAPAGRATGLRAPRRGGGGARRAVGRASPRAARRAPAAGDGAARSRSRRRGRARRRGRPARTCSSTSPCCTCSRPASRRSRGRSSRASPRTTATAPKGPATEYFRVHELRDVEHARAAAELIERADRRGRGPARRRPSAWSPARAPRCAGNWRLLDGVEAPRPRLSGVALGQPREPARATGARRTARRRPRWRG